MGLKHIILAATLLVGVGVLFTIPTSFAAGPCNPQLQTCP